MTPAGTRSPALTRSWAAPEQVLCRPVSGQTDQYPLGLMLLQLVEGALYGEEARVLIPVGGRNVEAHLTIPFLTWCKVPLRRAIGTAAANGLPIAMAGTAGYVLHGLRVRSAVRSSRPAEAARTARHAAARSGAGVLRKR